LAVASVVLAMPALGATLEPVRVAGTTGWEGRQFVAADRAGNVYFFRAATFEVFPLTKSGTLGKPLRLKATRGVGGDLYDAAISPSGDQWLLYEPRSVRFFVAGKEEALPPPDWKVVAAGFRRDSPVLAVAPMPLDPKRDPRSVKVLPWLQELGRHRWETLVEREGESLAELVQNDNWFGESLERDPAYLVGDRQGNLWAARRYAYRVQQFSPAGKLRLEILGEGGKIRRKDGRPQSKGIEVKWADPKNNPTRNPTEATHAPGQEKATFHAFTASEVIQDLVEGRDGRMYFLVVQSGGEAALDRFDPVAVRVERIGLGLQGKGRFTMAAGKDGLYLASWEGRGGRWLVPWEALELASWKEVEGITLDGLELQAEAGR
jgi:hypothetical protein